MDNPDKPASDTPEGPGSNEESSASGLSDLVHSELDAKPESKAAEPAALPADMPAFAPEPAPESLPAWEPPPMTVTFWQKLAPQRRGIRPIHLIVGLLVAIAGAGVAAVVVLRQPPAAEGSATVAAATEAVPAGAAAEPTSAAPPKAAPAPPPSADPGTDAGATRPAKTPKARARPRENRRKAPSKDRSEESRSGPAEAPVVPAPVEPAPAAPATAVGDPLTAKDIKVGVKQNMSKVKGCIKSARQAGVLAAGKHTLLLDWTIAPSGKVTDAHVRGPENLLNTSLARCFSGAMRRWQFPPSPKGAPVKNFPFGPFSIK